MRKGCDRFHERKNFFGFQTEFTLLLCYIHLDKNRNSNIMFGCFMLDRFCKTQRIHGMDKSHFIYNIFDFVALQMSDHVPADIRRKLRYLIHDLLYFVFSEISGTGIICFLKHRHRLGFADRDQCNLFRITSCFFACKFNVFSYLFKIFCYHNRLSLLICIYLV